MTDPMAESLPNSNALGEWSSPDPTSTGDGDSETPSFEIGETAITLRGVGPGEIDDADAAQLRKCIENTLLTAGYPLEAVVIEGQEND